MLQLTPLMRKAMRLREKGYTLEQVVVYFEKSNEMNEKFHQELLKDHWMRQRNEIGISFEES